MVNVEFHSSEIARAVRAHFVVSSSSVAAPLTFGNEESRCFAPLVRANADAAADPLPLRGNASSSELSPLTLIVLHQPRGTFWHQSDLSLKNKGGKKERQGHAQSLWLEISLRSMEPR